MARKKRGLAVWLACALVLAPAAHGFEKERLQADLLALPMPEGWTQTGQGQQDPGVLFTRKEPEGMFVIDAHPLKGASLSCDEKFYQMKHLDAIATAIGDGALELRENRPFFDRPMLIIDHVTTDGAKQFKEMHFLKDCVHYIATFGTEKKNFDEEWPKIQKVLTPLGK